MKDCEGLDFEQLEGCRVGAEPVRAETASTFHGKVSPIRLRIQRLSPAMGMAET
ncbi:MAG: hypothetical protein R3C05_21525 [Pirellulaceae bacterium]